VPRGALKLAPQDRPSARGLRVAIVRSLFNRPVTDGLLAGARQALEEMGADERRLRVYDLPGAFELPLAAQAAARSGRFDAVVALGAVIEATPTTTSTWPAKRRPASPRWRGRPGCRWRSACSRSGRKSRRARARRRVRQQGRRGGAGRGDDGARPARDPRRPRPAARRPADGTPDEGEECAFQLLYQWEITATRWSR